MKLRKNLWPYFGLMLKRECFNFTKALNRRLFRSLFREVFLFSAIFDGTPMLRYLLCLKAHPIKFGQSYKNSIVGQLNGHTPRNQSGFATPPAYIRFLTVQAFTRCP